MTLARTSPPAKLNLFLEIPAKRDDGFHEIDTVMVAIDWRDELEVVSTSAPEVSLVSDWIPSVDQVAKELGLDDSVGQAPALLDIPNDRSNLVVRALEAFQQQFAVSTGFQVRLRKRIPAGAGMGGASSDAAHAIRCAAQIHQVNNETSALHLLAASIGSDVPFFLGLPDAGGGELVAARARGRGEVLSRVEVPSDLHLVVAYPAVSLSTALVYGRLQVPGDPVGAEKFLQAWTSEDSDAMAGSMMNRLTQPAMEILPQLRELLDSLWQSGLQTCQLTGSGSACFGIAKDASHAKKVVSRLTSQLQPGVLLRVAKTVPAAAPVEIEPS